MLADHHRRLLLTTVYGALSRTLNSKQVAEERAELFSSGREAVLQDGERHRGRPARSATGGPHLLPSARSGGSGEAIVEFVTMNRGGFGANRVRPGRVLVAYFLDPMPTTSSGLFTLLRRED